MHPNKGNIEKSFWPYLLFDLDKLGIKILAKNYSLWKYKKKMDGFVLGVKKYKKKKEAFFLKINKLAAIFMTLKSLSGTF